MRRDMLLPDVKFLHPFFATKLFTAFVRKQSQDKESLEREADKYGLSSNMILCMYRHTYAIKCIGYSKWFIRAKTELYCTTHWGQGCGTIRMPFWPGAAVLRLTHLQKTDLLKTCSIQKQNYGRSPHKQTNSNDCGIFMCEAAEAITCVLRYRFDNLICQSFD